MDKQKIISLACDFIETSEDNYVKKEIALLDDPEGMKIFEAPIFGFGNANDDCFTRLKNPTAIGSHFRLPKEWLPPSKTVISFFLPFTENVKKSNSRQRTWPSEEWLYGKTEGQMLISTLSIYLQTELINAGYLSIVPSLDKRFWSKTKLKVDSKGTDHHEENQLSFTSNWSERHVAFVCGLGTFGLSKGLITKKGIAGRFGSIVTELHIQPDEREYKNIYEYCTKCGACIKQCPVNAISLDRGKNHRICSDFLELTANKFKPRYACGKCQVNVPCENCIPLISFSVPASFLP